MLSTFGSLVSGNRCILNTAANGMRKSRVFGSSTRTGSRGTIPEDESLTMMGDLVMVLSIPKFIRKFNTAS